MTMTMTMTTKTNRKARTPPNRPPPPRTTTTTTNRRVRIYRNCRRTEDADPEMLEAKNAAPARLVAASGIGVGGNRENTPRGVRGQTKVTGEANTTDGVNDHT
jgi:hypothetical protein